MFFFLTSFFIIITIHWQNGSIFYYLLVNAINFLDLCITKTQVKHYLITLFLIKLLNQVTPFVKKYFPTFQQLFASSLINTCSFSEIFGSYFFQVILKICKNRYIPTTVLNYFFLFFILLQWHSHTLQ